MTDNDVRNYLEKIYKVPVVQVHSVIKCGEIGIANIPKVAEKIIKKTDDYRLVFVKLPTNVVFRFPDLFPEKKEKEELKDLEALKKDYEKSLQEIKDKNWDRKDVPSWFGL
jgi:39S ribosomal protein L23, mitochondrial